jgi:type II secretory pathway pseudopilin PulG
MSQAESEFARAMEMGDTQAAVEANKRMIALTSQSERAAQAQQAQERQKQVAQQTQQPMQQQQAAPQVKRPDPKAQDWAEKNEWFGQDEAKTFAAFGIHKKLVEDEGFDPTSNDYYTELDRRISDTFGGSSQAPSRRAVQTVAGVSRNNSGRSSGRKVRLTPSQVAIAKKLGVPLEAYAKYVKE